MGGIAKGVGKAVKGVAKGVGKVVKGVAKGVKKVAGGVVKGIDKVTGGGFSKIMGKLGPIGSIGLGLLLPGAGSFLGGLWSSTAGAASAYAGVGQGFINAVGTVMNTVGSVAGGITGKIKAGFEFVGGKVSDGANYLFKGAQEFTGVKNPASIGDAGKWIVDKARDMNPFKSNTALPAQEGMFSSIETGTGVQNMSMSPVTPEMMGNYDMVTPMFDPVTGEAMGNAMASPSPWAATRETLVNQPNVNPSLGAFQTGTGNIAGGQSSIAGNTYMSPGGVTQNSLTAPPTGVNVSGVSQATRGATSLMDSIIKAGGSLLNNMAGSQQQQLGMMPQPYFAGSAVGGDDFASQRFGVGGQGSSGGDFLSEQQRYQQQLLAQQLSQLG